MENIGKVNSLTQYNAEWVIPNFFSLSRKTFKGYKSHAFSFNGESWYLIIYPNGQRKDDSVGYVDLYLHRKSSGHEISQQFSFSLKNSDGQKEEETHYTNIFKEAGEGFGSFCFVSRAKLTERQSQLLPAAALTVVCTLKYSELTENSYDRCICQDFKKMLLDGLNHDLILKVGDKELHAHKDVLRARSQVFNSMLSHDMKEKNSGVIDIPDCDPQAMQQFLSYIYSGKVDALDESNMSNLYYIADKYDMKELKEECSVFIKKALSIINICEVIQLALNHTDSSLLECTAEYFKNNMLNIMRTLEWQYFLKENSTVANELLIKSMEKLNIEKT